MFVSTRTYLLKSVGLYNWEISTKAVLPSFTTGGTNTLPTFNPPTYMPNAIQIDLNKPVDDIYKWIVEPVAGQTPVNGIAPLYTIKVAAAYKYSYLTLISNPGGGWLINCTETITPSSKWIITRSEKKDNNGMFYYIIENSQNNVYNGKNYKYLSVNGGFLLSDPGAWWDPNGSATWWYFQ